MLFNSAEFILFFLLFIVLWSFCKHKDTSRWLLITLSSLFFYAWWDWRFIFLILFSGLVDFFSGIGIKKYPKKKKGIFFISLLVNLGVLCFFKYSFFIADILTDFLQLFAIDFNAIIIHSKGSIILPLGISFYTFQSMSYTIDIYRNKLNPTKNIFHFFSYLLMFPQLVAGPIVRAKDLLKQLTTYRNPSSLERWNALKMICYGLFRKVVIADNLSYMIDAAFEGKTPFRGAAFWWVIAIAFSFQIYNDFSGYSLIARGLAKYMGYHFKMNFNHPYLATSFKQFWSRWHISLSTWFRDYVYIPLGGSRNGFLIASGSLLVTMFLSGLWHGANYTFIIWAALHSVYLVLERLIASRIFFKVPKFIAILVTFMLTTIAWVYFRAETVSKANDIVLNLFDFKHSNLAFKKFYFDAEVFLILSFLIEIGVYLKAKSQKLSLGFKKYNLDIITVTASVLLILFFRGEGKQFIYFQF